MFPHVCPTIVLDGLNDIIVLPKIGTGMRELLVSPGDFTTTVGGGGLVGDDFRSSPSTVTSPVHDVGSSMITWAWISSSVCTARSSSVSPVTCAAQVHLIETELIIKARSDACERLLNPIVGFPSASREQVRERC